MATGKKIVAEQPARHKVNGTLRADFWLCHDEVDLYWCLGRVQDLDTIKSMAKNQGLKLRIIHNGRI